MGKSDRKEDTTTIRSSFDKDMELPNTFENFCTILWYDLRRLMGILFSLFMQGLSDYYAAKEKERAEAEAKKGNPSSTARVTGGSRQDTIKVAHERPSEYLLYSFDIKDSNEPFFICPVCRRRITRLFTIAHGEQEAKRKFDSRDCSCGYDTASQIADRNYILRSSKVSMSII
jgi:hypothetical protein